MANRVTYTSRDGRTFNSLEEMDAHHNTLGPAPAQTPGTSYRQVNNLNEHGTPNIRDDIGAQVDAAVNGTGAPIQLHNATIGPGATPQQIEEAKRMLSYRADNQDDNWSTGDVVKKLAVGGAKAMAAGALVAGAMTLAGVGWGAGAASSGGGAAGGAAAAGGGGLAPVTTGGAAMLPGGAALPAVSSTTMAALPAAIATPAASAALTGASTAGGLFRTVGSFLGRHKDIVGSVLATWGEATMAGKAQEAAFENQRELLEREHELVASNYRGTGSGAGYRPMAQNTQTVKPAERYAAASTMSYGLKFNPQTGRMERELMPAGAP
jgi:hypothetical protein